MAVIVSLACYRLRNPASYAVPVMGQSQFRLGLFTFPSFCYFIMLFPGRVLTCCSFTELCHFVTVAHPLVQEFTFSPELSVNMFRDPELRQLAQALPYILVHDRAASTVSTYLGAYMYKSWKEWTLRHNACVLPSDSVTLAL